METNILVCIPLEPLQRKRLRLDPDTGLGVRTLFQGNEDPGVQEATGLLHRRLEACRALLLMDAGRVAEAWQVGSAAALFTLEEMTTRWLLSTPHLNEDQCRVVGMSLLGDKEGCRAMQLFLAMLGAGSDGEGREWWVREILEELLAQAR